jgi:peptide deformylase
LGDRAPTLHAGVNWAVNWTFNRVCAMSSDVPHAPHGPLPEGGTVRPMTRWGTPVMHRPQAEVTAYDDDLRTLVADMVATMYAADGVGLAACQVGVAQWVFVFDCPDESGERTVGVVCNPTVTLPEGKDRKLEEAEEGCLSFPGAYIGLARPDVATVNGFGVDGSPVTFEGDGLLARCLQHETDHTHGTVFADRLATKAQKKLRKIQEKVADEFPPGWPA